MQAIIGPQTSEQANFLAIMGSEAQIPIISFSAVSSSLSPSKFPYFVRMAQNELSQARSIASVIHAYSWREVVIIHDDSNSGIGLIPYLIDAIQDIEVKFHLLSSIVNKSMIHTTLRKISEMGTRVFIVHLSFSLGESFFIHAHKARMMADGYAWIITSELTNRLAYMNSMIVNSMQGVLGIKAFVPESNRLNDFKIRWKELFRRKHPEIEIIDVEVYTLWAYDTVWLMAMAAENSLNWTNLIDIPSLDVSSNGEHYLNSILDTEFRGLTGDVRLVDGQLQSTDFQIVNVLGNGGRGIGFWTPRVGLSRTRSSKDMEKNYSANMEDLDGVIWPGGSTKVPKGCVVRRKLRIGVPVKTGFSEFMKVERNPKDNSIIAKGFCIDVFEKVMKKLPYTVPFEYIPFENGYQEEPNYYDRLICQVYLKVIRFSVIF